MLAGLHASGLARRAGRPPAQYACRACEEGRGVGARAGTTDLGRIAGRETEANDGACSRTQYADHLPLYRQAQIYARLSITLAAGGLGRPRRSYATAGA